MRVRFQMAGTDDYQVKFYDLKKSAHKFYEKLKEDSLCEWAELVGDDEDDYMEVIESFEQIEHARSVKKILDESESWRKLMGV